MTHPIINELHKILVKEEPNTTDFVSVVCTKELKTAILDHCSDWYALGETVCGMLDPSVVYLDDRFKKTVPEFADFTVVRITERYLNSWNSETRLEFSNREITETEYNLYEQFIEEEA